MSEWLGIPFVLGGRTRSGMDCVGLVLARLASAGLFVDDPWKRLARQFGCVAIDASMHMPEQWVPVLPGHERELDVLVLIHAGVPCHVGVMEASGHVLHTAENTGSLLTRHATLRRAGLVHSTWRPQ